MPSFFSVYNLEKILTGKRRIEEVVFLRSLKIKIITIY